MKRPFAVIGFSMLATFLLITNISHKTAVALIVGATAVFCMFILVKRLRKHKSVIFSLFGVIVFSFSFISAEKNYVNEENELKSKSQISGVVCETPIISDYAFSYTVKLDDENYKVRFVSGENEFINEGDRVVIQIKDFELPDEIDMLSYTLSSRVYFTFFESDGCSIVNTNETDFFYKNVGIVKREFSNIVEKYLPGEIGAIAKAMTIGDDSQIDDNTVLWFKNCGTSHLLVISGLHLTLWSISIMRYLNKISRFRKYAPTIALICLIIYASITGFSVSVIRAGAMVGAIILARMFKRDADSINSIGCALFFILTVNPFAPFSVALWLTVFSTLGILVFSEKFTYWIEMRFGDTVIGKIPFYSTIKTSVAISTSVMITTLPVIIVAFKVIPTMSIISNLIMVEPALCLMILTVVGAITDLLCLTPISKICYFVVGIIGEYLLYFAEKIGMWEMSTLSLYNKLYEYFALFSALLVLIIFIAKRFKRNIVKPVAVVISIAFVMTTMYCTSYENVTPSVEMMITDSTPVVFIKSKKESALIGIHNKKYIRQIQTFMDKHNEKAIDTLVIGTVENDSIAEFVCLNNTFNFRDIYSCYDNPPEIMNVSEDNVSKIVIGNNMIADVGQMEAYIEISYMGKNILIINCEKMENLFQNNKLYDIIVVYGANAEDFRNELSTFLKDSRSRVIVAKENECITVN